MYDKIAKDASFWHMLIELDREICLSVQAAGCPRCGGPLDRGDYERKPRGIEAAGLADAFSIRFSTCCRHCRRRVLPPSLRFLGRRVYAGAIMILATMCALVCGAAKRTLARWRVWWTEQLPATRFWLAASGRLVPAVETGALPGALVQRFERVSGEASIEALVGTLRFLQPASSRIGEHFDGRNWAGGLAQKMHFDRDSGSVVRSGQTPATKS